MYTSFHISPHSQLIKAFIGPFTVVSFNRCNSLTRLIVSIYNNGSFENIWSILMFSIICISNKMHVDVKNLTQKIFTSQCCNALINLAYFTTLLLCVLLLSTSKCFLGCVEKIQKFFTFHLLKKANLLNLGKKKFFSGLLCSSSKAQKSVFLWSFLFICTKMASGKILWIKRKTQNLLCCCRYSRKSLRGKLKFHK